MDTPDGKRICSFRNFTSASVQRDVYKKLKLEWQPIMKKMENSPGVQIPARRIDVNQFLIDSTFNMATSHLRENICSFLFTHKNKRIESWTVGTWSSCTQRSHIMKNGSERDISNLPVIKRQNRPHTRKRTVKKGKRKRKHSDNTILHQLIEEEEKEETEPPPPPPPPPSRATTIIPPPRLVTHTTRHTLMITNLPDMSRAKITKVRKGTAKKRKTSKRKKIRQVCASFNAAFPAPESPHHNCTYTDCQLDGNMFFKVASEKCNVQTCNLELHRLCMNEHGHKAYGEDAERAGMKKMCKSCYEKAANDKGVNRL